jgi:adenylate cyclase
VHVYRVAVSSVTQAAEARAAAAPLLPDKPSIAVLPFTNMSEAAEQEFFAGGIAEDVITTLSRCPSLSLSLGTLPLLTRGVPST